MKTHKQIWEHAAGTKCGLWPDHGKDKLGKYVVFEKWSGVTCKKCLALKGKRA